MVDQFQSLTEEEFEKLKDAVPLITVLIAGADGEIHNDQLEWANKVTKIRSYNMKDEMKAFYLEVGKTFSDRLQYYIDAFPTNVDDRNKIISDRLSQLNEILAKLEPEVGAKFYKNFTSFAEHVAKASGGFLGFFAINKEEAKLIGLPMIYPIINASEEEE